MPISSVENTVLVIFTVKDNRKIESMAVFARLRLGCWLPASAAEQGDPRRPGRLVLILTSKMEKTMASYATTRPSSKGQVVVPEQIRNDLGLSEDDQFVVIGEGDAVLLKAVTPPKIEEFNKLLGQAVKLVRQRRGPESKGQS